MHIHLLSVLSANKNETKYDKAGTGYFQINCWFKINSTEGDHKYYRKSYMDDLLIQKMKLEASILKNDLMSGKISLPLVKQTFLNS